MKILAARRRDFLHWATERERVRLQRAAGKPAPWTKDQIIGRFRFCNVRRRHDRVSQWIDERIIKGREDSSLWVELALARCINYPDTINMLMEQGLWPDRRTPMIPTYWRGIGDALNKRMQSGQQTWTGAYIVRAESNSKVDWFEWGKGRYVAQIVVGRLWNDRAKIEPNLRFTVQRAHETLKDHYGWGSFMAGQVVADLTYSPYLDKAPDLYTFAPLGPGSARGINRLCGRELTAPLKQAEAILIMQEMREALITADRSFSDLSLHDVQNIFCEVDKYLRVKFGEGRPRSLYRPMIIGGER
jgi:hypothetical protein